MGYICFNKYKIPSISIKNGKKYIYDRTDEVPFA